MRIHRWAAVGACLLAMGLGPGAWASVLWQSDASAELSGSRDSDGGGIFATGDWNGRFALSWDITFDSDTRLYTYNYTVDVRDTKDISHFILEVTQDEEDFEFDASDAMNPKGPQVWEKSGGITLPNPLYGVKFDVGGEGQVRYTLTTDRAPVYGVFFAKDGKDRTGQSIHSYANALGYANYQTIDSEDGILTRNDFIVRPDGGGGIAVPTPAALPAGLAMLGILALVHRARRGVPARQRRAPHL